MNLCPMCGHTGLSEEQGIFFERGEFDGKAYEEEGDAMVLKCESCGAEFALMDRGRYGSFEGRLHPPVLCSVTIMDDDLSEFIRQHRSHIGPEAVGRAIAEDIGFGEWLKNAFPRSIRIQMLERLADMIDMGEQIEGEN